VCVCLSLSLSLSLSLILSSSHPPSRCDRRATCQSAHSTESERRPSVASTHTHTHTRRGSSFPPPTLQLFSSLIPDLSSSLIFPPSSSRQISPYNSVRLSDSRWERIPFLTSIMITLIRYCSRAICSSTWTHSLHTNSSSLPSSSKTQTVTLHSTHSIAAFRTRKYAAISAANGYTFFPFVMEIYDTDELESRSAVTLHAEQMHAQR